MHGWRVYTQVKPEVGGLMVGAFENPHVMDPVVAKRNEESFVPADATPTAPFTYTVAPPAF